MGYRVSGGSHARVAMMRQDDENEWGGRAADFVLKAEPLSSSPAL